MAGAFSLALVAGMLAVAAFNAAAWPRVGTRRSRGDGALSVLVPARDEAAVIAGCVESARRQGGTVAEILVYDDRSADATAVIVRALAAGDPRVRLLDGVDLPPGWFGKPHACRRLAEAASAEWLLFLDADARLAEHAAARLVEEARGRGVTLLSAWPALEMHGFWERALMPLLNVVVFTLYPAPLSLWRDDPALGLAHGACILVHRDTYLALGGHALVREEIFEDTRLAQRWRAAGARSLCLDGRGMVSVRMYRGFGEIWRGFQKNFYPAFEHEASFWAFLALHASAFVLPPVLLIAAPSRAALLATAGGVGMRALLAARFRHPLWAAFLHPAATVVLGALGLASRRRARRGGVEWKGRIYPARRPA